MKPSSNDYIEFWWLTCTYITVGRECKDQIHVNLSPVSITS